MIRIDKKSLFIYNTPIVSQFGRSDENARLQRLPPGIGTGGEGRQAGNRTPAFPLTLLASPRAG